MNPLAISPSSFHYRAMIGVGGIGAGSFFALSGNHTLGREESRGGRFLDRNDYCKLHIISHYVAALLGPEFATIPLGKVGDDEVGKRLLAEMREAGLDTSRVEVSKGDQTLFSFCFVYPDGSGGNMTTDDSACSKVDSSFVRAAESELARFEKQGVVLAVPEVPVEARQELLGLGRKHGFFNVASFTSEEIAAARDAGLLSDIDLLAINVDEAAAVSDLSAEGRAPRSIAESAVNRLRQINPEMQVSITAGANGSWSWDGNAMNHTPVVKADFVSSAGAGDAHLAGIIVGLVAGLALPQAQELGTLVAGLSVTSPHTINKEINKESLRAFADKSGALLSSEITKLLSLTGEG